MSFFCLSHILIFLNFVSTFFLHIFNWECAGRCIYYKSKLFFFPLHSFSCITSGTVCQNWRLESMFSLPSSSHYSTLLENPSAIKWVLIACFIYVLYSFVHHSQLFEKSCFGVVFSLFLMHFNLFLLVETKRVLCLILSSSCWVMVRIYQWVGDGQNIFAGGWWSGYISGWVMVRIY